MTEIFDSDQPWKASLPVGPESSYDDGGTEIIMTTLTRTQTVYIESVSRESDKMSQELQMMQEKAHSIPDSMRTDYDEKLRQLQTAYLPIKNNMSAWRGTDASDWTKTQAQMNHHLQAYNQAMEDMMAILRKARQSDETRSLGWVEGMAKAHTRRTEGWTEGLGPNEEGSEGWTEGLGPNEDTA